MTVDSIAAIGSSSLISESLQLPEMMPSSNKPNTFLQLLGQKLHEIDHSVTQSDGLIQAYVRGEDIPVQDIMISMSKAKLELQLALEIRNKVLDAYQEITRIQL